MQYTSYAHYRWTQSFFLTINIKRTGTPAIKELHEINCMINNN